MTCPMSANGLLHHGRIMLARQTVRLRLFRHLGKKPASLKLHQQIMHSAYGRIADGVQLLMEQGSQFAWIT
jgi:hypothetical protein